MIKVISAVYEKLEIIEEKANPVYEEEFNRLDAIGCFSIDDICKSLDNRGIKSDIKISKYVYMLDIPFSKLFYILDGMETKDLILLAGKIVYNAPLEILIKNIISSRNLKQKSLEYVR